MVGWSCVLMALGYVMSCGTRWYDVSPNDLRTQAPTPPETEDNGTAEHPVVPVRAVVAEWYDKLKNGQWNEVLAEPPFVPPPPVEKRRLNYWMMSVKSASLSFMTFNAGFSLFVYVLFYIVCDVGGFQLGLFRTFGRNALAGYLIQWPTDSIFTELVEKASASWAVPLGYSADAVGRNAPLVFVLAGFATSFAVNWLLLWVMERRKVFLKV
jgi:hypothetical protein